VKGLRPRAQGLEVRVWCSDFWLQGFGSRVSALGLCV
jgi:hypothetical protein